MHVVEREEELDEPVKYLVLLEFVVRLRPLLDQLRQVASLAVGHHHAQRVLVHKVLVVAHDANMVEAREDTHLLLGLSPLLIRVRLHLDLLEAVPLAVALVLCDVHRAVVTAADALAELVVLHAAAAAATRLLGVGPCGPRQYGFFPRDEQEDGLRRSGSNGVKS